MTDVLGDRMKMYEGKTDLRAMPLLPVMVRLDGKSFSSYTKGLARPYDVRMHEIMSSVTKKLCELTSAKCGYTQSDEISLMLYSDITQSQIYFDGRIQKLASVLSGYASSWFNDMARNLIPEKKDDVAVFDCRVWQVPNLEEAANVFLWREKDATKNSITMAAQQFASHEELHKKNSAQKQDILMQNGVNWNDYPAWFKRGTYCLKKLIAGNYTQEELEELPENHNARKNPNLIITRYKYVLVNLPPLTKEVDKVGTLFNLLSKQPS